MVELYLLETCGIWGGGDRHPTGPGSAI